MQHLAFLGHGIRFPFRFSERTGGTEESSEHDRIRESILQILETRPGERFMRPEFGSRVKDLVFEQNDAVLKGLLRFHITDAIKRWEKRVMVDVQNLKLSDLPNRLGELLDVTLEVQKKTNGEYVNVYLNKRIHIDLPASHAASGGEDATGEFLPF